MIRLFTAIEISPNEKLLNLISQLKKELKDEPIKWVETHHIHITLKFIGEVSKVHLAEIEQALSDVNGICPFSIAIEGLGLFRNIRDPRVIFSKLIYPNELLLLFNQVENQLCKTGIQPEERAYAPHLTLGRIKYSRNRETLQHLLHLHEQITFQTVECQSFCLFESQLTPKGPIYKKLREFPLG